MRHGQLYDLEAKAACDSLIDLAGFVSEDVLAALLRKFGFPQPVDFAWFQTQSGCRFVKIHADIKAADEAKAAAGTAEANLRIVVAQVTTERDELLNKLRRVEKILGEFGKSTHQDSC